MSATIPDDGRGEVTWTNLTDNWRKEDADWLQERSIVRNVGDPAGAPAEGRLFYNATKHALRLRNSDTGYTTVVGSNNISITDGLSTSEIKVPTATVGTGITFNNSTGAMSLGNLGSGITINVEDRGDITSPTRGQIIYENSTGSLLVYYGATTGWLPPWNQSWGFVGGGDTFFFDTPFDVPIGTDITTVLSTLTAYTLRADRRYAISAQGTLNSLGAGAPMTLSPKFTEALSPSGGGVEKVQLPRITQVPNEYNAWTANFAYTPATTDDRYYRIRFTSTAVGTTMLGGSYNASFTITDIGPYNDAPSA